MARAQTFTRCALRFLIHDPDMPDTVREWLEDDNEPEQRALLFAVRLSEDFLQTFRDDPAGAAAFNASERHFYMRFVDLASRRVDWRRVAECLLERFAKPDSEGELPPPEVSSWVVWAPRR